MFKRRKSIGVGRRIRGFLWPHAGWKRASTYVYHRLMRLPGTPHSIAAGFACGAALSFTPFLGFHFLLAGLLAWGIGGNIIASAIGTAVGNPWTFPLIWTALFRFGSLILGVDSGEALPDGLTLNYMLQHPFVVLLPMTVGSIPIGLAAWGISYWLVRHIVGDYQELRRRRRSRREAARLMRAEKLSRFRRSANKGGGT